MPLGNIKARAYTSDADARQHIMKQIASVTEQPPPDRFSEASQEMQKLFTSLRMTDLLDLDVFPILLEIVFSFRQTPQSVLDTLSRDTVRLLYIFKLPLIHLGTHSR